MLKADVVAFPIVPFMPQAFGWFKKPVKSWADLKGRKFRIPGIGAEILKEAGMAVVTLPGGEIVPAGERGVIDGAEWVGGIEDLKLGFQEVWKYHYAPGMIEPVSVGELIINRAVWEKLPSDLKEIVKAATTEVLIRWFAAFHKKNAEGYKTLIEKHKVQVIKTPDDILRKTLEVWDKIAAQEAAKDPFYKKVLDSQKQWASLVVPYRLSTWPSYEFAGMYYWKGSVYGKPAK
jgi:TRAP-type mannitol/chloroaromatic compound transport system substrate-binding protein